MTINFIRKYVLEMHCLMNKHVNDICEKNNAKIFWCQKKNKVMLILKDQK